MENRDTWGQLERIIDEAIKRHEAEPDSFYGVSLVRTIADAIREKYLPREEEPNGA